MNSLRFLQIDVGNSAAKWRLLEGREIIARGNYSLSEETSRVELLGCTAALDHIWISSVASPAAESELADLLSEQWRVEPWFARTPAQTGSLLNSYEDPSRMGVDRWLAMLAAWQRQQGPVCVVDAGSALTIDMVIDTGQHQGGYIIPGAALMERALLLDTERVRFEQEVDYDLFPGTSTAEAVRHGIALAQVGAVSVALDACAESMALYFCGGGGEKLRALLQRGGEYIPDLVFEGLEILAAENM